MRLLRILHRVFWDYWFNWSGYAPWDMTWTYGSGPNMKLEIKKGRITIKRQGIL